MNRLPLEVIGNILSRLGGARDVVIASATCRKWREACRKHLHTLSFNIDDWPAYQDLTTSRLEILITQTVFQTTGLQGLCIFLNDDREFSASTVIAWLMYTRETLRSLKCNVGTTSDVNILEICGRQKLETLELSHNLITGVDRNFQRFPCLKSLSLHRISISALDLSLLLSACPKIENLGLICPEIAMSDAPVTISSLTLTTVFFEAINLDKFILEADSIEYLHIKECTLELFELVGKGTLKHIIIDDVTVIHFDIGEKLDYLEVVDVSNFTIVWPKFYQIISNSKNLKKLRFWDVHFDDDEVVDLENVATCFPQLNHLALSCDLREGVLQYGLQGSAHLAKVSVLELGWTILSDLFSLWVEGMVKHCPNLKMLIIHGSVSEAKSHEESQMLANFTLAMVQLLRKYIHVDVRFEYE